MPIPAILWCKYRPGSTLEFKLASLKVDSVWFVDIALSNHVVCGSVTPNGTFEEDI
jgi:hypothetical protein